MSGRRRERIRLPLPADPELQDAENDEQAGGQRRTGGRKRPPAIVEQLDCTTVVEPGNRVEVDVIGNLIVTVG